MEYLKVSIRWETMLILIRFWREIAIIILTIFVIFVYLWKDNQAQAVALELNQYKDGLEFQNATILSNAQKLEEKAKELPKVIEKIKTKYEVIYANIDDFKGDVNETNCNNALIFLNGFKY